MRKPSLIACSLALACLASHAEARRLILAATDFPPYFSESLPEGGPVMQLTVTALKRAGNDVTVVFMPWARAMRLGELGAVDAVVGVWSSPGRQAAFLLSQPVVSNRLVLCRKKGAPPARFTDFAALAPYSIGLVRGYADPPGLAQAARTETVDSDLQNLRKLLAGRIDLVLIDVRVERDLVAQHLPDSADRIECLEPAVQEPPQHLAVSRQVADAAKLVAQFDEQMKKMRASGEVAEITSKAGF